MERKNSVIMGLSVGLISFMALYLSIKLSLGTNPESRNIVAFGIYSLIVSLISITLLRFKLKHGINLFFLGLIIGFIQMNKIFLQGATGWEDLAGIMSIFIWPIFGLISGLVLQLVAHLLNKKKN